MGAAKYKRIILKLSGESLAGDQGFGINPTVVEAIAKQIKKVHEEGVDVAIVVGVAISGVDFPAVPRAWIELRLITWVCLLPV